MNTQPCVSKLHRGADLSAATADGAKATNQDARTNADALLMSWRRFMVLQRFDPRLWPRNLMLHRAYHPKDRILFREEHQYVQQLSRARRAVSLRSVSRDHRGDHRDRRRFHASRRTHRPAPP